MTTWLSHHLNPPMALFMVLAALFVLWGLFTIGAHNLPHQGPWRWVASQFATMTGLLWSGTSFVYFAARFYRMVVW